MGRQDVVVDGLLDGGASELQVDGVEGESLIVLRRGQRVFAYHNVCPHAGRRLNWAPGRFLLDQGRLVCAAHGAVFEAEDGLCIDGPCRGSRLRAVAVRDLGDGRVEIGDDD